MTYEDAFDKAVRLNAATGSRMKIYYFIWDRGHEVTEYILPQGKYSILIGEVGRRTPR